MLSFRLYLRQFLVVCGRTLSGVFLLFVTVAVFAGGPPYGIPSGAMPWEYYKYQGYKEPPHGSRPRPPEPAPVAQTPAKYTIQVTLLPNKHTHDNPNVAVVVAHLPEDARIWFEGRPTKQTGMVRYFESPILTPGKNYSYTTLVQWYEDGRWVSQMHAFPIHAGDVHCIDIVPRAAPAVDKRVEDNLARLAPEDLKLAEAQRFCAVQEGIRLGAMGVPVKIMLNGQSVFLCCKACEDTARKNPEQTLERIQRIKAKKASSSSP